MIWMDFINLKMEWVSFSFAQIWLFLGFFENTFDSIYAICIVDFYIYVPCFYSYIHIYSMRVQFSFYIFQFEK